MKQHYLRGLLLILIVTLGGVPIEKTAAEAGAKRLVGYYASWSIYDLHYSVSDIPGDKLTHVNYAFANTSDNACVIGDPEADLTTLMPGDTEGKGQLHGNINQLKKLKQQNPNLKVLISIGGWGYSKYFSDIAASDATRKTFVASCIDMFIKGNYPDINPGAGSGIFDGIDIDWEYPRGGGMDGNSARPEDHDNFTLLMAEFRRQLDDLGATTGQHYLLSIAVAAEVSRITDDIDVAGLNRSVDYFNLMAYDFAGSWSKTTNFAAPLYNNPTDPGYEPGQQASADDSVMAFIRLGVAPEHLNLGVPFYGHGWGDVPNVGNGLFQPAGSVAKGPTDGTGDATGIFTYKDLKQSYETPDSGFKKFFDKNSVEAWLYNPDTQIFIAYDDPQAMSMKAQYINNLHLGGAMFWDLSGDDADHSLVNALYNTLHTAP